MKIKTVGNLYNTKNIQSFKAATININAFSDTHGELLEANYALEEMRRLKQDIFCPEQKGKQNVLAVCGDWFIDGARKGYSSDPQKPVGKFQLDIFNELIRQIKEFSPEMPVLFTPGNHEFDGGIPLLDEILSDINAGVLFSNLDIENSSGFSKSIGKNKIFNKKIIEIEDDKNSYLKHRVLFLGIAPVNLQMYQKQLDGVCLLNNSAKIQSKVEKEDYQETLDYCKKQIEEFKQDNPNGVIVLLCHTGVSFADNLAKESDVDIIFDGHEHKENIRYVNGTPIIPLSQNFKKIVNTKIRMRDDGALENIEIKSFNPFENKTKGPLYKLYLSLFKKDLVKKYSVLTPYKWMKILSTDNIRTENNYLANFVTDSLLGEIKREHYDVDFFAINSSAIRHPLKISEKPSVSVFDIMNVLSGISSSDGRILINEISGETLAYLVIDNIIFNKDMPQKNPLIHYAGLSINRTAILREIARKKSPRELTKYIVDTKTKKPVNPDKMYRLANVEKYFNKSQNPFIKELKKYSYYTDNTVQELFKNSFEHSQGRLYAKCDVRIQ